MKNMKKIASLVLALVMVFALTVTAFAEDTTYSITIDAVENSSVIHTYEVYQIFTGDLSTKTTGEGETAVTEDVLSNIEWGSGVTAAGQTTLGDADKKAESLKTTADAEAFAETLVGSNYLANPVTATKTDDGYVAGNLAAGYYLVKDQNYSQTGTDTAYTAYILEVVKNVEVTPKTGVPTIEIKVKDVDDSEGTPTDWQDSADYDVGDTVPFQVTATLPKDISAFDGYRVEIIDVLGEAFTYDSATSGITVEIGDNDATSSFVITPTTTNGVTTLTIRCDDVTVLGATGGSVITVTYNAVLDSDATNTSGEYPKNTNTVSMKYSNDPNASTVTGTTSSDIVRVFTHIFYVFKVDGATQKPLSGAEFDLYKYDASVDGEDKWVMVEDTAVTGDDQFKWDGLDDGRYKLVESKTPSGYSTIEPIEFTLSANHDVKSDDPKVENPDVLDSESKSLADYRGIGNVSLTVENFAGSILPSTGGMGTTVFYVVGGVLVLAAVVLLVTKKRMNSAE